MSNLSRTVVPKNVFCLTCHWKQHFLNTVYKDILLIYRFTLRTPNSQNLKHWMNLIYSVNINWIVLNYCMHVPVGYQKLIISKWYTLKKIYLIIHSQEINQIKEAELGRAHGMMNWWEEKHTKDIGGETWRRATAWKT